MGVPFTRTLNINCPERWSKSKLLRPHNSHNKRVYAAGKNQLHFRLYSEQQTTDRWQTSKCV